MATAAATWVQMLPPPQNRGHLTGALESSTADTAVASTYNTTPGTVTTKLHTCVKHTLGCDAPQSKDLRPTTHHARARLLVEELSKIWPGTGFVCIASIIPTPEYVFKTLNCQCCVHCELTSLAGRVVRCGGMRFFDWRILGRLNADAIVQPSCVSCREMDG